MNYGFYSLSHAAYKIYFYTLAYYCILVYTFVIDTPPETATVKWIPGNISNASILFYMMVYYYIPSSLYYNFLNDCIIFHTLL